MYPDGVCRVTDNYYTKTVQFQDINYQLNQNEDKTAIFDGWCDFLNYFDSSIRFQLSFINLSATRDTYARRIAIPLHLRPAHRHPLAGRLLRQASHRVHRDAAKPACQRQQRAY